MSKLEKAHLFLVLLVLVSIAASFAITQMPRSAPDDAVGIAMLTLLAMAVGILAWTASLILAITSYRDKRPRATRMLTISILTFPVTLTAFAFILNASFR